MPTMPSIVPRGVLPPVFLAAVVASGAAGQALSVPQPSPMSFMSGIDGSEGPAYFTDIHIARLTSDGSVLAYDLMDLTVLEFRIHDGLTHRLGREGGGPGEFRRIDDIGVLGDSVWVKDRQQRRISWFVDGEAVGVNTVGGADLATDPFTFVAPDRIVALSFGPPDQIVARLVTRAGEEIDSIAVVPRGDPASVPVRLFDNPNRAFNVFADRPLIEHSTSGEAVVIVHRPRPSREGQAEFRVIRLHRGETRERRFTQPTRPLADYETARLDRIIDALYEQVGKAYGTPRSEIAEVYEEALNTPEFSLPVYDARIEDNGRVWLATRVDEEMMEWVWLDQELEPAGAVRIPQEMHVFDINNGMILTRVRNEWDVPSLCIYAVHGLPASSPTWEAGSRPPSCMPGARPQTR